MSDTSGHKLLIIFISCIVFVILLFAFYDACGFKIPFFSNIEEKNGYGFNSEFLCKDGTHIKIVSECKKYSKLNASVCLDVNYKYVKEVYKNE